MYSKGRCVPRSKAEALKWFTRAAELGDLNGQYQLGLLYKKIKDDPSNQIKALEWLTKAAECDFLPAEYELGVMYSTGDGVQKDYDIAMHWFDKVIDNPDSEEYKDIKDKAVLYHSVVRIYSSYCPPSEKKIISYY